MSVDTAISINCASSTDDSQTIALNSTDFGTVAILPYVNASETLRKKKTTSWIHSRKWKSGEVIGKGSFGKVYQCMNDKVYFRAIK